MNRLIALMILTVTITSAATATADAESLSLRISPVKTQISVEAGASRNLYMRVENTTSISKTVTADFRDTTVDGSGTRTVAPKGYTNNEDGTSTYMSGSSSFVLNPGQIQNYTATITLPASAVEKTRYGSVLFTADGDTDSLASLIVATITSTPAAATSPPQRAATPDAIQPQPAVSDPTNPISAPTAEQPLSTFQASNSDQRSATVNKNINAQPSNKVLPLASGGLLVLLLTATGIVFWKRKGAASTSPVVTTALPPASPTTTDDNDKGV